ncbi:unnamed protein product [Pylaiella littoralis]
MENASALASKLGDMKGLKKGLELARVAQQYAQQQGIPLPSLSGNGQTMNDTMPGPFGQPQQSSGGGLAGLFERASSAFNGSSGNDGFNTAAATAATAAGFGGMSQFAGGGGGSNHEGMGVGGQRQSRFGRSRSFGGSNTNGFGQQQQQQQRQQRGRSHSGYGPQGFASTTPQGFGPNTPQGFGPNTPQGFGPNTPQGFGPNTPQGFGPNTPGMFDTPGTYGPPTPLGTPGYGQATPLGFDNQPYPPAYTVMDPPQFGFSGAMTTQGQPFGAQQAWSQQPQQSFNNAGFANQVGPQPGFMGASPGFGTNSAAAQRGARGGNGWNSAGMTGAAGLAAASLGAGLASTYNRAFGDGVGSRSGGGGGAYDFAAGMPQGFPNQAAAYGGPGMPPAGGKTKGKKGGGNKNKPAVVVEQPPLVPEQIGGWLHVPAGYELPEGIPKGLEILAMVDGLMVHQEVETLEAIANAIGIGYEGNNQYKISNRVGVHVYQAVEDTNFCWRCCCTQLRPVHMKVFDQTGAQVLAFQRHFRLFPCAWFEPCRENVTVFHGAKEDGKIIGRVTQSCCGGCCTPKLNILSRKGDRELIVKGPCVIGDCCGVRFDVLTDSKKRVGEVKKLAPSSLADIAKEIATDADKFTISFPQDLKVETKATALVSLLLVDLLFFENGGNTNRNLDGTCTIDLCVMFCCGCPVPCRVTVNGIGGPDGVVPVVPGLGKGAPVADEIVR